MALKWGQFAQVDCRGGSVAHGEIGFGMDKRMKRIKQDNRVQTALRESEARYRAWFDDASDAIFILDLKGKFIEVNTVACERLGYSREELLKLSLPDIDTPDFSELIPLRFQQLERQGYAVFETAHRRKDGTVVSVEASVRRIEFAGQPALLSIARDITERKRVEAALRASEQYARSIVDSSLDMIIAVDNQRRITEFNPAAQQVFGYTRDEVIGKHISMLYADSREGQSVHQTVYLQGKLIQEIWNKRKNGEIFPSYISASVMRNDQGESLGVVGVSRDITASKQAEESLKRRDAALAAVTFAAEQFLRSSSWEKNIPEVFERLGKANRVSRVYLFENDFAEDKTLFWKQRYEWTSPGILPQIDNPELQHLPVAALGYARWRAVMEKGQLIQGNVKAMPLNEQSLLNARNIKSIVVVPIFARQIWWGFLGFDECALERDWSVAEIDVLLAAADTLGAAIEREWIDRELRTRARDLELLNEITHAAIAISDLHPMLQIIVKQLGALFDADGCLITLWDEDQQHSIPTAVIGTLQDVFPALLPEPGETTLTQSVLSAGQPLAIDDVLNTPYVSRRIAERLPAQSMLCLPLLGGGRKLGAALISFTQFHHFSRDEVERGAHAAVQIALAISRAQLFAAEQQRATELEALRQASLSLTASLELSAVLDAILASILQLMPNAEDAHIYIYENDRLTFGGSHWRDGHKGVEWSPPRENGLTYTVARTSQAIIVPNMRLHPLFVNTPSNWQGAIVGLPLKFREHLVGVMTIALEEPHNFLETELRSLRLLADQAAVGIENARLYVQVQRLAVTDPLTGCYNRRGFTQIATAEMARAARFDHSLSMLMIDVDHFKMVNDTHGHALGDKILVALVECCRGSLRSVDIIGRHGGEEFVVLLPETNSNIAAMIAERLRATIEKTIVTVDGHDLHLSISVGVASMDQRTTDIDMLIAHADQAQYRAKQMGRNSVAVYTD